MQCSLMQFRKEPAHPQWQWTDISVNAGGHLIDGSPAVTTNQPGVLDIFANTSNGSLVQFHADQTWSWTDISSQIPEPPRHRIAGDPAVWASRPGVVDVFARSSDETFAQPLVQFHADETWSWTDISANAGGHPIEGDPVVTASRPGVVDVFVRSEDSKSLVQFHGEQGTWSWTDISANAGGHPIAGDPAVIVSPDGVVNIFVRGDHGSLVQFRKEPADPQWQWTDISANAGGHLIQWLRPAVWASPHGVVDVFALGEDSESLVQFHGEQGTWSWTDITANSGGHPIEGAPVVTASRPGVVDVFVRGGVSKSLVQFHGEQGTWSWTDITANSGGRPIGWGRPAVNVSLDGVVNIFAFGECPKPPS